MMNVRTGIKISLIGTGIEVVGMVLDIMHHIDIGITSPEGLLTLFHGLIFVGFLVNCVGVIITLIVSNKVASTAPIVQQ